MQDFLAEHRLDLTGGDLRDGAETHSGPPYVARSQEQIRTSQIELRTIVDLEQPGAYAIEIESEHDGSKVISNRLQVFVLPKPLHRAIAKLNTFDRHQVDLAERPHCQAAQADTKIVRAIREQKETLERMGTEVQWQPAFHSYRVSSSQLTPDRNKVHAPEQRCRQNDECVPIELPLAPCSCQSLLSVRADAVDTVRERNLNPEPATCPAVGYACPDQSKATAACIEGWCIASAAD